VGIGTIGAQATGNINGWFPGNLDQANLTGIVLPSGVLDPFESQAFNVFNRANFLLAVNGGGAHNQLGDAAFGQAAGALISRNMQFGLKLGF
jgi:hypothetical protein